MWLIMLVILLAMVGMVLLFKRDFGPTRSVAHVLYDTEHPRDRRMRR